ncbi:MAG: hypothetical protein KC422_26145 [Trueperaceae bacterium]|nr:hypothetical protein [Trueperaceae bacterium]
MLKLKCAISALFILEIGVSTSNLGCSLTGQLRYLEQSEVPTCFKGVVEAHLPFIGYSKEVKIGNEGQFFLNLQYRGDYVFFFEVNERRFSLTVDLESYKPLKSLSHS